jgi:hypothetical protein
MHPVYPPQDRLMGPSYYPPMASGQQQGYSDGVGFNSMSPGFDPQCINYPDMVGYHDGVGGVGIYSHEMRDPDNFGPGFGDLRGTQVAQLGAYCAQKQ